MANLHSKARGLRPVGMIGGGDWQGYVESVYVPATDSNGNIGIGDAVALSADGSNAAKVTTGEGVYNIGTLRIVTRATAGDDNPIAGVVVGVEMDPTDRLTRYRKDDTARVLKVVTHPDVIYEIVADEAFAAAKVNANAVLVDGSPIVDTVTGFSNTKADGTTANNESYQLQVLGISRDMSNQDVASDATAILVRISRHAYQASTGEGLGV